MIHPLNLALDPTEARLSLIISQIVAVSTGKVLQTLLGVSLCRPGVLPLHLVDDATVFVSQLHLHWEHASEG